METKVSINVLFFYVDIETRFGRERFCSLNERFFSNEIPITNSWDRSIESLKTINDIEIYGTLV